MTDLHNTGDACAVARKFFAAVERGDIKAVAAIYHPQAKIWHNYDGKVTSAQENIEVLRGFIKRAPQRRYADARLLATPTGFVQQHNLRATRVDGRELTLPACVICEVSAGQITRLDEYFDSAPLAGWYDLG